MNSESWQFRFDQWWTSVGPLVAARNAYIYAHNTLAVDSGMRKRKMRWGHRGRERKGGGRRRWRRRRVLLVFNFQHGPKKKRWRTCQKSEWTPRAICWPILWAEGGKFKKFKMGWTFVFFAKIFPVIPFVVWGGFFGQQCRVLFESFRIDVTSFDPF